MLGWIKTRSLQTFTYNGVPVMGDGWIESPTLPVTPRSLYYAQLQDRLGPAAVGRVDKPTASIPVLTGAAE